MRWRPARTADGSPTLVHPLHGEACHPAEGAWTQALGRYAAGCRLEERLRALAAGERLRVLDFGCGLGLNLAAAVDAWLAVGREAVGLELVTLERERAPLEHALALGPELAGGPPRLRRAHALVRRLLRRALAHPGERFELARPPVALRLLLGEAQAGLSASAEPRFDALFLDPFSPRVEPDSWRPDLLARLARRLAPGGWLATYSAAGEVRAALCAAGLRVGAGERVGRKREGTLASPDRDPPPLAPRVARRILRRAEALRAAHPGCFSPPSLQAAGPADLECPLDPLARRDALRAAERLRDGPEESS